MDNSSNINEKKIIVSIEGNIGVGKSTFINILKSRWEEGCEVVYEPVDIWKKLTNSDGKNILQTFYENIPRWAYSFQNVACITRMMKIEEAIRTTKHKHIFLDRSLGTDKNVFEAMLYDDKKLNQIEHLMYNLWCDFYHNYLRPQDDQIYIYLKASPNTCANRIKKRGRIEEESIGLEYLKGLNNYHDKWLLSDELKSNVIVIDCEEEFEQNEEKQSQMIQQIKTHIDNFFSKKSDKNKKIRLDLDLDLDADSKSNNNKIFIENI